MKKVISLLLSVVMLFSITAGIDWSTYADTSGDFEYTILKDGTAEINRYTGSATELIIPSTLDGYTVTSIGQAAFHDIDSTRTVVIPDTVTKIGVKAFCSSDILKNVTIGKKVITIESEAFYNCNISNVFLPVSLITVGSDAFKYNGAWYMNNQGYFTGQQCDKCHVYYGGNETQWDKILFSSGNDPVSNSAVEYNSNSIGEHVFGNANIVQSDCVNKGYTYRICKVCHYEETDNYVNATGHSWDNGKVTKTATCKSAGVKTYTCKNCKTTKTEAIAKTAHTYKTTTTKATTKKNGSIVTKCTVCGAVKSKSTIYYPKTITLSATSYTYDGKTKKPTVTVKDSKGNKIASSNYTVSYSSGRKNVGTYTVTIKFKGNYSGTVKKTFTIKPKATSISSISAKSKGFTVKWKKLTTQTTGYQIQYSTSNKFTNAKTVTVSKNSTTSKTISKLSAKKKYYVRVRTYKTVNGKKIYSAWSSAKSVTTKK